MTRIRCTINLRNATIRKDSKAHFPSQRVSWSRLSVRLSPANLPADRVFVGTKPAYLTDLKLPPWHQLPAPGPHNFMGWGRGWRREKFQKASERRTQSGKCSPPGSTGGVAGRIVGAGDCLIGPAVFRLPWAGFCEMVATVMNNIIQFLTLFLALVGIPRAADASDAAVPPVDIGTFLDYTVDQVAKSPIITLKGTVSYVKLEGTAELVIEDSTGGVMTHWHDGTVLESVREGQYVEVKGQAGSKRFSHRLIGIGLRILPPSSPLIAQPANFIDLKSGRMECRLVETEGLVRSARIDRALLPPRLLLNILTPAGEFTAWVQRFDESDGSHFVDSQVKIRGVCLAWSNFRKQPSSLRLIVSKLSDVTMTGIIPRPAFEAPVAAADTLFAFRREGINLHRVRLKGVVTWCGTTESFTLQSGQYGISVQGAFAHSKLPIPGDEVEVAGFPEIVGYSAGLTHAVWKVIRSGNVPQPIQVTAFKISGEADSKNVHQRLICLKGTLVSQSDEGGGSLFELRDGSTRFQATLAGNPSDGFTKSLRAGSILSMTGICEVLPQKQQDYRGFEPHRFVLRLRSASDIEVLYPGPWFTIPRLLAICAAAAFGLIGLLVWNHFLRITVDRRTRFLAGEIRSRHDRNVQFNAILRERERLAAELHDTVQQGLLATALQVEAASLTLAEYPAKTPRHLALAQRYLEQSREGLRRSVWNLYETKGAANDIATEMEELIDTMNIEGGVSIALEIQRDSLPLGELITRELIRLAGELISNAIRHSSGTQIVVAITHSSQFLTLEVKDNGIGFDATVAPGPTAGHFGITGMRDRAKRIGAQLTFKRQPGSGTTAAIRIPHIIYDENSVSSG